MSEAIQGNLYKDKDGRKFLVRFSNAKSLDEKSSFVVLREYHQSSTSLESSGKIYIVPSEKFDEMFKLYIVGED